MTANNNNSVFINPNRAFLPNTLQGGYDNLLYNDPKVAQRILNATPAKPAVTALTPTQDVSLAGLGHNALANLGRIGTGLTYVGTHVPELVGEGLTKGYNYLTTNTPTQILSDAGKYLLDYKSPEQIAQMVKDVKNKGLRQTIADDMQSGRTIYSDVYNAMAQPYNLTTKDIAKTISREQTLGDLDKGVIRGLYENPIDAAIDLLPAAGGLATKGVKAATKAEKGIAATTSRGAKLIEKTRSSLDKINELPIETRTKVLEAAETGNWTDDIKVYKQDIRQFSKDYSELVPAYAKVDAKEQAIIQKYVRDNNIPYQQASRDLTPALELLKTEDGVKSLKTAVDSGDKVAEAVYKNSKLFDKGDIFPITHAMEQADEAAKAAGFVNDVGGYAGRFSTRAYGLTDYRKMAEELQKPNELLQRQLKQYTEDSIGREIANSGTIGGQSIAPKSAKDIVYISRAALENGNTVKAFENVSKEPLKGVDSIAIDKHMAAALKDQMKGLDSAYKSIMGDIYNIQKSTLLSQGTYLAGNAITGTTNMLMNSGAHAIDDIIAAIGTRGKLAKEMGIYRRDVPTKMHTKAGEVVRAINDKTGGELLRHIDKTIQNSLAEIAAHEALRRKGIRTADRIEALDRMSLKDLGEAIVDTQRVALLSTNRTILPKSLAPVVGTVAPFWQWSDTAMQASYHMLKKNPALANVALIDILSTIGFDKEMQNRLNLGVDSDKPLVSYRFDDRTGKIKEARSEFIPMMNTITLFNDVGNAIKGKSPESMTLTNTALGEIFLAAQGKNRYGNPLKSRDINISRGNRYRRNPETGRIEQVEGGLGSEIAAATVRGLFGVPSFINKTGGPMAAEGLSYLTGQDWNFYRPYDNSIFGSLLPQGKDPRVDANFFVGGNPERPRGGREMGNALTGVYETDYYRERPSITSMSDLRSLMRSIGRSNARSIQNINR